MHPLLSNSPASFPTPPCHPNPRFVPLPLWHCPPAATSSHAGHWNQIAQVLLPAGATTKQAARLFALLNAAIWDASIVAYRAKYATPFWRPITAIR